MKLKLLKNYFSIISITMAIFSAGLVSAKDISQEQLQQAMKANASITLVDVRSLKEFNDGHVPNAVNIPLNELPDRLSELAADKKNQIVLYCRSGKRAEMARQVLAENGFTHLDHLDGDFNGWSAKSLPIIKTANVK